MYLSGRASVNVIDVPMYWLLAYARVAVTETEIPLGNTTVTYFLNSSPFTT